VDVDDHTAGEARENFEEESRHVGVREGAVRAVDEEDIAPRERREDALVHLLQRLPEHLRTERVDLGARLRIDGGERRLAAGVANRLARELRGVPGAYLDDVRGAPGGDDRIERHRVERGEEDVVPVRRVLIGAGSRNPLERFATARHGVERVGASGALAVEPRPELGVGAVVRRVSRSWAHRVIERDDAVVGELLEAPGVEARERFLEHASLRGFQHRRLWRQMRGRNPSHGCTVSFKTRAASERRGGGVKETAHPAV
jgi:hypothetical protein